MDTQKSGNKSVRTRKDLLVAAAKLMQAGKSPTIEEVASEALVSRATAYRYFPNVEDLLIEAPVDAAVPDSNTLFADKAPTDIEDRIDYAEGVMHDATWKNGVLLRQMLLGTMRRSLKNDDDAPLRQNRRTEYIEKALAPARGELNPEIYRKLRATLALIFGTEAMVVFQDVLRMNDAQARKAKSWAVRTLVRAAVSESKQLVKNNKKRL